MKAIQAIYDIDILFNDFPIKFNYLTKLVFKEKL